MFTLSVSFGVEFEFDYLNDENRRIVFRGERPIHLADGWDYQEDYTASSELRSPVFTSLEQFIHECNNQFGVMVYNNNSQIPYMCNDESRSLGQHMHVGKPNTALTSETKKKLARAIVDFYPLLAALHAQPIPSRRGLTTVYARSLIHYNDVISDDHYCEISDSHVGTVELRIFDSNIPQASLVNAFFITEIAKKVFRGRSQNNSSIIDFRLYDEERSRALRYGLVGLNVTNYLRRLRAVIGNVEIPDIPAVREALYLMARYRLNFYGAWKYSNVSPYQYMRAQLSDCSKYLENLLSVNGIQHEDKIRAWIDEAQLIENLDQLIGLSIGVDRSLAQALTDAIEQRLEAQPNVARRLNNVVNVVLSRSEVRNSLARGFYRIARINELRTLNVNQVAEHISYLLARHGEGLVDVMSAEEIINTNFRFYVLAVCDEHYGRETICGTVAINVRTGEIRSLVVDRRFRRLGIARTLLMHILAIAEERSLERVYTYVKLENTPAINLFSSLGFRVEGHDNGSYLMIREVRRE
jgi:GNAT superfamily N-acetyltransferase